MYISVEYRLDAVDNTLFAFQFIDGVRPKLCDEIDYCVGTVDYPPVYGTKKFVRLDEMMSFL